MDTDKSIENISNNSSTLIYKENYLIRVKDGDYTPPGIIPSLPNASVKVFCNGYSNSKNAEQTYTTNTNGETRVTLDGSSITIQISHNGYNSESIKYTTLISSDTPNPILPPENGDSVTLLPIPPSGKPQWKISFSSAALTNIPEVRKDLSKGASIIMRKIGATPIIIPLNENLSGNHIFAIKPVGRYRLEFVNEYTELSHKVKFNGDGTLDADTIQWHPDELSNPNSYFFNILYGIEPIPNKIGCWEGLWKANNLYFTYKSTVPGETADFLSFTSFPPPSNVSYAGGGTVKAEDLVIPCTYSEIRNCPTLIEYRNKFGEATVDEHGNFTDITAQRNEEDSCLRYDSIKKSITKPAIVFNNSTSENISMDVIVPVSQNNEVTYKLTVYAFSGKSAICPKQIYLDKNSLLKIRIKKGSIKFESGRPVEYVETHTMDPINGPKYIISENESIPLPVNNYKVYITKIERPKKQ